MGATRHRRPPRRQGRGANHIVRGLELPLIEQFAGTTDSSEQHKIMNQIQGIMLEEVPVIPVTESVSWYQYDTKALAGWPTKDDPYAAPAPWNIPDWEQVLLKVHKG